MMRLPYGVKDLFSAWLAQHFPDRKDKVLGRIRAIRGGKLNDSSFKSRMRGEGLFADMIKQMFAVACAKEKFPGKPKLSAAAFRRPNETPTTLFGA